ncbi:MAG: hypothetical protein EHM25_02640 [Nitrosopumilales archaeon]|nr:MAG: hypothetical protein EHM25_12690 [Nitrosopumilales archaeon]RPJ31551.1 MAG: hypothetical protein EHM25_02640 [Nitrosopumilales archaeon]
MIKKQIIKISVVFDTREAQSIIDAIDTKLFNTDGVMDWEYRIEKEEVMKADFDGNLETDEEDEDKK